MRAARHLTVGVLCALAVAAVAPLAAADPVAFHVVVKDGQRRIVIDTPVEVTGRPPAPSVAILHPPLTIDYHWPTDVDSFIPHIVASVAARVFDRPARAEAQ
jgi:hypothetical protein